MRLDDLVPEYKDEAEALWNRSPIVDEEERYEWFTNPHPDLQDRTPVTAINAGDYKLVDKIFDTQLFSQSMDEDVSSEEDSSDEDEDEDSSSENEDSPEEDEDDSSNDDLSGEDSSEEEDEPFDNVE